MHGKNAQTLVLGREMRKELPPVIVNGFNVHKFLNPSTPNSCFLTPQRKVNGFMRLRGFLARLHPKQTQIDAL